MQKKVFLLLVGIALFGHYYLKAQWNSPFGNSVTDLNDPNDRVGIGINDASVVAKLHVRRLDNSFLVAKFQKANVGDRTALIDIQSGNGVLWRYGVGGTNNGLGLNNGQFYIERWGAGPLLTITHDGKFGIGNANPATTLDVLGGNWDVGATEGDFRIGNSTYRLKMGVALGGAGAGDARIRAVGGTHRIMIGVNDALTIGGNANVGIGTIEPTRKLQVAGHQRLTSVEFEPRYLEFLKSGGNLGQTDFRFEHAGSSFYLSSSNNDFSNICDIVRFGHCADEFKFQVFGDAIATSWQVSDQKLKKNIANFSNAMGIINKLKPKQYYFKTSEYPRLNLSHKKQYGFVAQEMEGVLPEIVSTSTVTLGDDGSGKRNTEEIKAINYTELIPVLVKALQEQQEELQELRERVNKLSGGEIGKTELNPKLHETLNVILSNSSLDISPNPAGNSANIRYDIPSGVKSAEVVVTDNNGITLKRIQLSANAGILNVNTAGLKNGTYDYSLIVAGKVIATRKMVVAR